MSSEVDAMQPIFFKEGPVLSTNANIYVIDTVVNLWMESMTGDHHYICQ